MTHTHTAAVGGRRQDLQTPRAFFLQLHEEFGFTLDAAASPENALCPRYFTREDDALRQRWDGVVWCNPPYNRCHEFVGKGAAEADRGATVVMLVPVRADTSWWHDVALRRAEIRWLRGRLRFGPHGTSAPFASCLLVFRPRAAAQSA